MLKINFLITKNNKLKGFEIKGHANFAENGKDIVCAAVSSAAYMTINLIEEILKINADVKIDEGYMKLFVDLDDEKCVIVLKGFKFHMHNLQNIYQNNLRINYTEVK